MKNEIKTVDNMQKYENYKEQFKRLNMALSHKFFLEAVFISYAIMEDRSESILRHSGKWDAYLKNRRGHQVTIDSKINYIKGFAAQKMTLLNKYFGDDLLDEVLEWKDKRNQIIHALMKQFLQQKNWRILLLWESFFLENLQIEQEAIEELLNVKRRKIHNHMFCASHMLIIRRIWI